MPARAVSPRDATRPPHSRTAQGTKLELIYVGNCVSRRGLPIVFEALGELRSDEVRLPVVGNGEALEV
jgi:hypothetical protein